MKIKRAIKGFIKDLISSHPRTFAQCGEDIIIKFLFESLQIEKGFYLDIGANDPVKYSNTCLLYKMGWSGVNVDPQAGAIKKFNAQRKRDVNLQVGIGSTSGEFNLNIFSPDTLSTFDDDIARRYESLGHKLVRQEKMTLMTLKDLMSTVHFKGEVDLLSLDIEGGEMSVIHQFAQLQVLPKVIICETINYSPDIRLSQKNESLIKEILEKGYSVFADTYINTIFIRHDILEKPA